MALAAPCEEVIMSTVQQWPFYFGGQLFLLERHFGAQERKVLWVIITCLLGKFSEGFYVCSRILEGTKTVAK